MDKATIEFLKDLVEAPSPSGYEQPAMDVVRDRMKQFTNNISTDVHGNVMGVVNPDAELRVMLAGHCDEIGLMVKHISDEGFIYFAPIGGIDISLLPGGRVKIHTEKGPLLGVIGKKPIHLMEPEDRKKTPKLSNLWIDIGARNKKDAEKTVAIGDPITFDVSFETLKNNLAVSKGFDDKAGAFVVCETLRLVAKSRKKSKVAVYGVATVQEELGLRGAQTAAFGIDPHVGIAVDVDFASDYPTINKTTVGDVALNKGPVIARGANINPVVHKRMVATARKNKIPYQISGAPRATGTDANVIQVTRAGVAAGLVSVPNRYMHTPVELVSLKDLQNTARLLAAFILDLKPGVDFTP
ncbi:M42 family metallopeptidase [Candidatus Hydrogenedentota bacterium]